MVDDQLEQIVVDVANTMGDDVSYLSAPSDRNFDPVSLLYGFASGIVIAFGSGILSELGSITAQKIVETCKRYLASTPQDQQSELERLASNLKQANGKITSVEITLRIEASTPQLVESLKIMGLPQAVADVKAAQLQQTLSKGLRKQLEDLK